MTSRSAGGPGRVRRALAAALAISLLASLPLGAAARDPDRASGPTQPPAPATSPAPAGAPVRDPSARATAGPPASPASAPSRVQAPDLRAYRIRPGDEPSQMYLDAAANEGRTFAFTPGGRASVGFRPRADDTWPVDGHAPRALPAGRLSGVAMAGPDDPAASPVPSAGSAGASPSTSAPSPPPQPAPATEPSPIPAVGASLVVPAHETALAPAAVGMRRDVYGFLPYWEVADADTRLDFSVITHLAYFSVGADARGNLKKRNSNGTLTTGWAGWTSSRMTSIINAAHAKHSRVTLTLSVFGWTSGQAATQKALLGSPAARLNLARQAAAAVRDRGADGINLDFEPLVAGSEDDFVALVRTIRAELRKIGPGYHLSFDTLGYPGNYPLEGALASGGADAVLIMGYDYRTAGSNYAGSIDPLAGPAYDLTDTVRTYTARVPASRVILGVPYYGRAWSTVSSAVNSRTQTGAKYGYSSAVNYSIAVDYAAEHGRRYDGREVSAWVAYRRQNCTATYGCLTSWRQIYYDDAATLKARYDLVNRAGLRGAGIWALGYDGTRRELYQALADKFLRDTTPPRAGIVAFGAALRPEVGVVVTWTAADDWSGVAAYDVQVSADGGAWANWILGTRATRATYLGADNHGYAFRVRARDGKGNLSAWNVTSVFDATPVLATGGFVRVVADTISLRAAPSTTATRVTTAGLGDVLAITGGPVSSGGYQWYELAGPLGTWGVVADVQTGVWAAVSGSGSTYAVAAIAPNATSLRAGIRSVGFAGRGAASIGAATSAAASRRLSPNGDGSGDQLAAGWNNRRAFDSFSLRVFRPDGTLLGSRGLATTAAGAQEATWDGTANGTALPDGTYILQLVGSDAGVAFTWPAARPTAAPLPGLVGVTIDRVPPTFVSAAVSATRLSPNGDGRYDAATVTATGSADAVRWELRVRPIVGATVASAIRTIAGTGRSAKVSWNGMANDGSRVPDGAYRAEFRFYDAAGNPVARAWRVAVDTTPPVVAVSVAPAAVSPDRDGVGDTTRLAWHASEAVTGTVRVLRGTTVVRSWKASGTGTSWTWDGRDSAGRTVQDGSYTVAVTALDALANRVTRRVPLVVDRTVGWLRWSATAFYPQDRDALEASTVISAHVSRPARLTLRILDATGAEVRRAWTGKSVAAGAAAWRWDGRVATGGWAPPGRYVAELTAIGPYGTTTLRRAVVAAAFTTRLSTSTPRPGTRLSVTFRSVEPLAAAPNAVFRQAGRAAFPMTMVRLADGSWRASVTVTAGAPGQAVVTIRGRDIAGGQNRTTLTVIVP